MARNNVIFIEGQGGLGTPLPGEDFISAMPFYTADGNLPSGFSTTNRIKGFGSIQDAEAAGILGDYTDATAATATYAVSAIGVNNDKLNFTVNEPGGTSTNLGTYTKVSTDSTVTLIGDALALMINVGTYIHGYSATNAAGTVSIKAPKKFGIGLNSGTPVVVTITGTIAGTLTQFTGGTYSLRAVWHYHIKEYFRIQPQGFLYVGFFAIPGTYDFSELYTMQVFANGKIRLAAIYKDGGTPSTSDLGLIQTQCNNLKALHMPISRVLYTANMVSITDLTTLTNLNALSAQNTSFVIAQDGAGLGYFLYLTTGKSISAIGATLGALALASVEESIAHPAKFNMSDGFELDTIGFANGQLHKNITNIDSLLTLLDNYRYIYLYKPNGITAPGSFFNNDHAAVIITSDYAFGYRVRVIDKAIRGIYATLFYDLSSDLALNDDGTLQNTTIAFLKREAEITLIQMRKSDELSNGKVLINPTQPVFSTRTIVITVKLLPIGIADFITVNIGFTPQI